MTGPVRSPRLRCEGNSRVGPSARAPRTRQATWQQATSSSSASSSRSDQILDGSAISDAAAHHRAEGRVGNGCVEEFVGMAHGAIVPGSSEARNDVRWLKPATTCRIHVDPTIGSVAYPVEELRGCATSDRINRHQQINRPRPTCHASDDLRCGVTAVTMADEVDADAGMLQSHVPDVIQDSLLIVPWEVGHPKTREIVDEAP